MGGMSTGTNWLIPIVVLGLGLGVGLLLALFARRGGAAAGRAPVPDDVEVRDLRVRRDQLLAQLRELDDTAGKRSADELARARWALEIDAAQVLRTLAIAERRAQAAAASGTASTPPAAEAPKRSGALVGAAWGGGVVGFAALLFFFLQGQVSERAPGGSITGNDVSVFGADGPPQQAQQGAPQPDPELEALVARAQANPQDVEAQLDLAQGLMYRERLVDVFQVVQAARAIEKDNPRALTYEAVVRHAMGLGDVALQLLDQAVAADPKLAEAWVRRGLVAFDLGKWEMAATSWEKALEIRPDGKAALEPVIAEARLRMQGGPAGEAATQPAAPAQAQAPAGQPPAAQPAAAAGQGFQVVLDLDPTLAGQVAPGTPIFISVRQAGVQAGPPAAAKRLTASQFPVQVAIGPGDTMMGQPLPEKAFIEARIDADGNAMTRSPDDPTASADGAVQGDPIRLQLRVGG